MYPDLPTAIWILDEGAYLETTLPVSVTPDKSWLFVQFLASDTNDGVTEILVRKTDWNEWLEVGRLDTFGRLNNWISIEGLEEGDYFVRVRVKSGRTNLPPQGCGGPADDLNISRIGSTAPVSPEDINITSGGWIPVDGGKANLAMEVHFRGGGDRPQGNLTYVHHVANVALQSTEILGVETSLTDATILFLVRGNDDSERTMMIHVYDGAEAGEDDSMQMWLGSDWSECINQWIYTEEQVFRGGQVKIH
jgi:hypothetical protein